jgi:hypothetical protein
MIVTISDEFIQPLVNRANKLYEAEAGTDEWLKNFTLRELAILWEFTCTVTPENPYGACYDDEVFEALDTLNYFKDI